jgi:hypothetical protein
MIAKILVLLNYFDRKLQICKITNICNPTFVTFGRTGTWLRPERVIFGHDFRVLDDPAQLVHDRLVDVRLLPEGRERRPGFNNGSCP